jgi:hypothetical protein
MRRKERTLPLVFLAALVAAFVVIAVSALGCGNSSNTMSGPTMNTGSANIAGTWSGSFQSDSSSCAASSASMTLQQDGSNVTGNLQTSTCGVAGLFKGTLNGSMLTGSIAMEGCIGGQLSGTVSNTGIALSVGDLTKPLITGDQVVMWGGVVTLRR